MWSLGLLVYCVLSVVGDHIDQDNYINTSDFLREVDFLKIMFLFSSLVFDLYKWCVFILASSKTSLPKNYNAVDILESTLRVKMRRLRITLVIVQASLFFLSLLLIVLTLRNGVHVELNETLHKIQYYYTVTLFSVFLAAYLLTFVILTKRLKTYYPKFYARERAKVRRLWNAKANIDFHFKYWNYAVDLFSHLHQHHPCPALDDRHVKQEH